MAKWKELKCTNRVLGDEGAAVWRMTCIEIPMDMTRRERQDGERKGDLKARRVCMDTRHQGSEGLARARRHVRRDDTYGTRGEVLEEDFRIRVYVVCARYVIEEAISGVT